MERLVSIRLRDTGQNFIYNAHDLDIKENDYVIVEHDRGLDYGQVVSFKNGGPVCANQGEGAGCAGAQGPSQGNCSCSQSPGQGEVSGSVDVQAAITGECPCAQSPSQGEGEGQASAQCPGQGDGQPRPSAQVPGQGDGQARASAQPARPPVKRIIRIARESDLKQIEDNRARSKEAFTTCQKKIAEHRLEMKLVQAEYSFDRSKIIFYFTSGGRVDFRNLVKDLAKIFKARIELRQIGVRDETKFFGGYGPCGRQLCCATFLKDFEPVTIKMAKEEGLPLNPPKISGICGRLMCCLNYEYETYKMLSRGLPREGERIITAEGKGKVINVSVFKRTATVELEEGKIIQVVYKEKADGSCERMESVAQQKAEPDGKPENSPGRPERPGRRDYGSGSPERPPRQEQRGERQERGGRPDNRNDRQDRNRQDRQHKHENRGAKPWQQRQPGQDRPGQQRPNNKQRGPDRPGQQRPPDRPKPNQP